VTAVSVFRAFSAIEENHAAPCGEPLPYICLFFADSFIPSALIDAERSSMTMLIAAIFTARRINLLPGGGGGLMRDA